MGVMLSSNLCTRISDIKMDLNYVKRSILVISVQINTHGEVLVGNYYAPIKVNVRTSKKIHMRFDENETMHYL